MSVVTSVLQTGHVGLNVSDIARSKQFYQIVFGFSVTGESHEPGHRSVFLSDGQRTVLTLWEQSQGDFVKDRPGLHHLSFRVNSVDEVRVYEERLKAIGAHFFYDGVVPHGEGQDAGGIFFADPDGIRLEIFSPSGAGENPAPSGAAPTCGFF